MLIAINILWDGPQEVGGESNFAYSIARPHNLVMP